MYQKAIGSVLGLAVLVGIAAAGGTGFNGDLPADAGRVITHFQEEVNEGITAEEIAETKTTLRKLGGHGTLYWPGGTAKV